MSRRSHAIDPAHPEAEIVKEHVAAQLTPEEHALLKDLLRPGVSVEALIKVDATPDELWHILETCSRGLQLLESRICRLKPVIGQILLRFERNPSLYKSLGYNTFTDFMRKGVYLTLPGIHTTSAFEATQVARLWPQISPDRYAAKLGPKKIGLLSKFTSGGNANGEAWLQTAESMTTAKLKTYVEERGFLAKGESTGATIVINTNRALYDQWKEFCSDGRVQSVVGGSAQDRILEALMQEGSSWLSDPESAKQKRMEAKA
jgi:hypothetical protein